MRTTAAFVLALACAAAAPASAQLVETWESGNSSAWTPISGTGPGIPVNAAAARNGAFGAGFRDGDGAWYARAGSVTAPGTVTYASVRLRNTPGGRTYLAVGASGAGAWSAVFAPNTNQLVLQENTGFTFVDRAVTSVTFAPNAWYTMALDWALNGDMTVRLSDAGGTQIASTATVATGFTTPGLIALRAFSTSATSFHDVDDIGIIPAPGAATLAGLGLLLASRRRRA